MPKAHENNQNELLALMNVGEATLKDFQLLGINTKTELADADADELYWRLQILTEQKHDPCVWDIFSAAINEAKTGEKQRWWVWTKVRKKRQLEGDFSF
jgi:hypothetical protein